MQPMIFIGIKYFHGHKNKIDQLDEEFDHNLAQKKKEDPPVKKNVVPLK